MTDPLLTLVARAIAKADGKDPDAPAWVQGYGNREQTFGVCWRDQYLDKAQAALSVIREQEPTEAMIQAGCEELFRMKSEMIAREQSDEPEDMPDYDEGDLCSAIYLAMQAARPLPAPPLEKM